MVDHARHTPYSDPGRWRELVAAVPATIGDVSAVARNLIVHYRASACDLPRASRDDIHARWLDDLLAIDQRRHPVPLTTERPEPERVQGCCRDHTLVCLAILRTHGVPARSRVGYAGYFVDGWHHDHVVAEAWTDGRWRRFDPEIPTPRPSLSDPTDLATATIDDPGFVTAAQVWIGYRRGELDAETYGVDPDVPVFRGERFVFDEVIHEVAHRFGDELLLWDAWGRMGAPGSPVDEADARWLDGVAALLAAADDGDHDAEQRLLDRYRGDPGLHPGRQVVRGSPYGDPPVTVPLRT